MTSSSPSPPSPQSPTPTTPSTNTKPKPIANPRRLLILTPTAHSLPTIPPLLHSLTGVPVSDIPTATDTATPAETETQTQTQTQAQAQTFAGYTNHTPLHIENRYYTAEVPVWVDEIPIRAASSSSLNTTAPPPETGTATATALEQWKTEFSSAEARIVRDAIGGVMVCLRNLNPLRSPGDAADPAGREDVKSLRDFLRCIGDVKRLIQTEREGQDDDDDDDGGGLDVGLGDVLGVIVLVEDGDRQDKPRKPVDDEDLDPDMGAGIDTEEPFSVLWWEDQLDDIGLMDFEVVSWDPRLGEDDSRDKYGEYRGMRRIRQILETHDWSANDHDDPEGDITRILGNNTGLDNDLEGHLLGLDSSHGFNLEVNELEREMLGLRMAIEHGDEEGQDDVGDQGPADDELKVESMEALMLRMQAIKDMSADLPENERRRFAAKAVRDIMKEI